MGDSIFFLYKRDSDAEPQICYVPLSAVPLNRMSTGEIDTFTLDFSLNGYLVSIPFVNERLRSGGWLSVCDTQHIRRLGIADSTKDATTFDNYERARKELIDSQAEYLADHPVK